MGRIKSSKYTRIKFDLDKLQDSEVAEVFKAMIGGRLAPLPILDAEEIDNGITSTLKAVITKTPTEILGKHRPRKKPWVTNELLDLCHKWRALKRGRTHLRVLMLPEKSKRASRKACIQLNGTRLRKSTRK